jgi:hypothetical protein
MVHIAGIIDVFCIRKSSDLAIPLQSRFAIEVGQNYTKPIHVRSSMPEFCWEGARNGTCVAKKTMASCTRSPIRSANVNSKFPIAVEQRGKHRGGFMALPEEEGEERSDPRADPVNVAPAAKGDLQPPAEAQPIDDMAVPPLTESEDTEGG